MIEEEKDNVLKINNLHHSFKKHKALDGVSFSVAKNAIHGFVGPNGAGKTTTLKIISTLLVPTFGKVDVFGHDVVKKYKEVRRRIGFMPDHFSMYRQMTVFEYLDFFAAAYGLEMRERDRVIEDVLALTDMDNRKDDLIKGLSRGMQQRVSLARVLVHDPELLLLDEPASGLDPRARIELMEILQELSRMGKTIFISSHILSELADLCDSVTILDRGKVKYSGSMDGLLTHDQETDERSYVLKFSVMPDDMEERLLNVDGITQVDSGRKSLELKITIDQEQLGPNSLLQTVIEHDAEIIGFKEDTKHLNQAFMDLTEAGVRNA
jgi:ABC-2 type transport system ATP-binding protein